MSNLLLPILLLSPLALYMLLMSGAYFVKKLTFNLQAYSLGVFAVISLIIAIAANQLWWITLLQIIAAGILFVILVYFFGGKAAHDTIVTFVALVALTPFSVGIIPLLIGVGLFIVYSLFMMRRQRQSIVGFLRDTAVNAGAGATLPDFSSLPDRKNLEEEDKKRTVSLLPFFALSLVGTILYYTYLALTLER